MLFLLFLVDWFGVTFTMFVFSSGQIVEVINKVISRALIGLLLTLNK